MQLKTNNKDLLKVLTTAFKAVPSKAAIPMMENFLIKVADNNLSVTATDGGITVSSAIEAEGEGSVCVEAKRLIEAISLLPDTDIEIVAENNFCDINYGNGKFQIPAFDPDDFPTINTLITGNTTTMICAELKEALAYVSPSIGKDTLRPQLCGVYFSPTDDGYEIVTTESRTLSMQRVKNDGEKVEPFILPAPAARFLKEQLPDDDESVLFSEDDSHVAFYFGKTVINATKVVGNFPNYKMVIPTANENKLVTPVGELLSTVKRVSTCSNRASNSIKFTLSTLGGATIEAQDIGFGCEAKETLDVNYNGEDLVIGFKWDLLINLLSAITETDVTIAMDGPKRAVLITTDNESRKAIIMPVSTAVTQ